MKLSFLRLLAEFRRMTGLGRKNVDMDKVIQENLDLIKQIRMNRIKFYRHYKRSQSGS